jgi:hypothetical protein
VEAEGADGAEYEDLVAGGLLGSSGIRLVGKAGSRAASSGWRESMERLE